MPATKNAPRLPNSGSRMIAVICNQGADARGLLDTINQETLHVRTVKGAVSGSFAAHPKAMAEGWSKTEWSVTHVPSGIQLPISTVDSVSMSMAKKLAAALGRLINAPDLISIIEKKGAVLRIIKDHIA